MEQQDKQAETLKQYAEQIRDLYNAINTNEKVVRTVSGISLIHGITVGHILCDVKGLLSHGRFEKWVEYNTTDSIRTAQRYMRIAKASTLSLLNDCQSLTEARRIIGDLPPLKIMEDKTNQPDETGEPLANNELPINNDSDTETYNEELERLREEMSETILELIEDENNVTWSLSCLRISRNGNVMIGVDGSGVLLLRRLVKEVSSRTFPKLSKADEIQEKALVVISEIIKLIIRHNQAIPMNPLQITDSVKIAA